MVGLPGQNPYGLLQPPQETGLLGINDRLSGLATNPLFNFGLGMLGSKSPHLSGALAAGGQQLQQGVMLGEKMKDNSANRNYREQMIELAKHRAQQKRTIQGADGYTYYEDGTRVLPNVQAPSPIKFQDVTDANGNIIAQRGLDGSYKPISQNAGPKREIKKDANGRQRYADTGELVFNNLKVEPKPEDKTEIFNQEDKLRKEYINGSKNFVTVRDAYNRITASASDPSAAGDLALIFNYMKVLDPGSTVREGEFATAQNSGGVPERVISMYNKVISGERLAPQQRADFVGRSGKLFNEQVKSQAQLESEYRRIAGNNKLNPDNILLDYGNPSDAPELPRVGQVQDGYIYMGGDPASPTSWKKQ